MERVGILVLLALIVICLSVHATWERSFPPPALPEKVWVPVVRAADRLARESKPGKKKWPRPVYRFPPAKHARPSQRRMIDINEADSATWESLYGIGPVLAARIVRFREKLGGFYAVSQVRETYGLPDSTFVKIQASLRLGKVSLNILDINHADEQTLAKHPYIRYKIARLIVLYRNNHGPFGSTDELLGIPLVDDSIYRKIEPYIKTIK